MTEFWDRVDLSGDCWIWTGAKRNDDGYGVLRVDGRRVMTHRYVYEWWHDAPIPEGAVVMHTCDNPPCVRPTHLMLGTYADNNRDRANKGRSATGDRHGFRVHPELVPKGSSNGKAKLTEAKVRAIRASDESSLVLAERFGVSDDTVRRVRNGSYRAWKWVQ